MAFDMPVPKGDAALYHGKAVRVNDVTYLPDPLNPMAHVRFLTSGEPAIVPLADLTAITEPEERNDV